MTAQALDAPWQWTVSAIPNQVFDSREAAEAAMRGLGGYYALAEVVESEAMTETGVTYTYGAKNRDPNVGLWGNYLLQFGSGVQPTEEAAIADAQATYQSHYACPIISVTRKRATGLLGRCTGAK